VSQQMRSHPQQQTEFAGCLLKILGITRWPGHRARYVAAMDPYRATRSRMNGLAAPLEHRQRLNDCEFSFE